MKKKPWAYYNEKDPSAAQWIRELIKEKVVAPGEVDERSIEDVVPADLRGFDQHHFFAGIGVWSHSLIRAGWPDDRRVVTASCPCQPFSAAGKQEGLSDERHLWPVFFELFQSLPSSPVLFGEQVSSNDALEWFDVVKGDLNSIDYSVCAADIPSAVVGAPHIRQRLYFVAEKNK